MEELAINGGKPVRDKFLPYGHQWIDDEDIKSVVEVLKGDWITQGPKIKESEEAIAKFTGAKYAVALSSGTAALHAACFAAGITTGDEVITTPITFAASSNCILYLGGKPVFADIKEDTYNINPQEIEKKITNKTKAIIPVDFAGHPADLDEIRGIAKEHNLRVIEDASHALGAEYKGKKIGSLSDLTIFSFHPVKPITTGEGGIILTNNEEYYEKLLMFRTHGITKDSSKFKVKGPWYYEMQYLGFNYRITDFQCALGMSQLAKLDVFLARRREIVEQYNEAFKNIDGLTIPITNYQSPITKSAWHLYIIKVKKNRTQVFNALREKGIGVQIHYIPVYYHPYYQRLGYKKGLCPEAERYYKETITLPLFPKMTDKNTQDVIKAVRKVTGK